MRHFLSAILVVLIALGLFESCQDAGTAPPTAPPVTAIAGSLDSLFATQQDTVFVTLSGGTPPYSILTAPNASVASATLTGTTLRIVSANIGSSSVTIGDASTIQGTKTFPVIVESPVLFASTVQTIFNSSYGCSGCHSSSGSLSLNSTSVSYLNLVGVQAQAGCVTKKRVLPRDPDNSALYMRLAGTCDNRMPKGGNPVSSTDLLTVRKWIRQGAKNN